MLHALYVSAFLCGIVNRSDFCDNEKSDMHFAADYTVRYLLLLAHNASGGSILSLSLAGC